MFGSRKLGRPGNELFGSRKHRRSGNKLFGSRKAAAFLPRGCAPLDPRSIRDLRVHLHGVPISEGPGRGASGVQGRSPWGESPQAFDCQINLFRVYLELDSW